MLDPGSFLGKRIVVEQNRVGIRRKRIIFSSIPVLFRGKRIVVERNRVGIGRKRIIFGSIPVLFREFGSGLDRKRFFSVRTRFVWSRPSGHRQALRFQPALQLRGWHGDSVNRKPAVILQLKDTANGRKILATLKGKRAADNLA